MKTHAVSTALLIAACGGSISAPLLAAPKHDLAAVHPVTRVTGNIQHDVKPGTSLHTVREALGEPDQKLTPDIWVYENFRPRNPPEEGDECSMLVIRFNSHHVKSLSLANARALSVMVARADAGQPGDQVVAAVAKPMPQHIARNP